MIPTKPNQSKFTNEPKGDVKPLPLLAILTSKSHCCSMSNNYHYPSIFLDIHLCAHSSQLTAHNLIALHDSDTPTIVLELHKFHNIPLDENMW